MNYAVITGDVIKSRQVPDRKRLQEVLVSALGELNSRFNDDIAVPFQITLGDEFQGMLVNPPASVALMSSLREALYPVKVRLSVGIGGISTEIDPIITKMDGPAFHFARQGINDIARLEKRITAFVTADEQSNTLLKALTLLSDLLLMERTDKQWEAFRLYRVERNLKKVAAKLGVKFQNVHKRLQAAHWDELEEAENRMADYVESLSLTKNRVNNVNSPEKG